MIVQREDTYDDRALVHLKILKKLQSPDGRPAGRTVKRVILSESRVMVENCFKTGREDLRCLLTAQAGMNNKSRSLHAISQTDDPRDHFHERRIANRVAANAQTLSFHSCPRPFFFLSFLPLISHDVKSRTVGHAHCRKRCRVLRRGRSRRCTITGLWLAMAIFFYHRFAVDEET